MRVCVCVIAHTCDTQRLEQLLSGGHCVFVDFHVNQSAHDHYIMSSFVVCRRLCVCGCLGRGSLRCVVCVWVWVFGFGQPLAVCVSVCLHVCMSVCACQ